MKNIVLIALIICLQAVMTAHCQDNRDSTANKNDSSKITQIIHTIRNKNVSKRLLKSITRKKQTNPTIAVRSEDAFMPFEGKIIRHIDIRHIGFDKTVYDTTRNIRNTVTRVSNALHSNSKVGLIRDNLFVRENKPLSPYKLADNERYLRDLDFILDAKFYVVPLRGTKDSVDLVVLTRDVFSLGASFNPSTATKTRFKLSDANLGGYGQRVQFNGLIDQRRTPNFGYEALYRKNSIGGSFINGSFGYTQLNTGSSYGEEQENAFYIRLDRALVSPYTRFAGGLEISRNWSGNFYGLSDSVFRNYHYLINDVWAGYNIGANGNSRDRSRHFVAIRAFDQHFTQQPTQEFELQNPLYNNRKYVLAGITFFKQNFYIASYIYGFGRTEDVPYGHRMSLYVGYARQLGLDRPYVGFEGEKSIVNRRNEFYTLGIRGGAFQGNGLEDVVVLVYGSLLSRLISFKELLIRQSITMDYTRLYKSKTNLPLDINNDFGLRYFVTDSLRGSKRFHLNSETVAYTPISILGFRMAPFIFGEMAMLNYGKASIFSDKPYFGFGGGLRTRNENLIFGTIEVRLVYFPRTIQDINTFSIRVSSNLRVKYSASFVKPPSMVTYN